LNLLETPTDYADYIFWNGSQWEVGSNRVSIGAESGQVRQSATSIAIGLSAGNSDQGASSIALGFRAGLTSQGVNSIAIGDNAGQFRQGANAIALGTAAGITNQFPNTIILNATGSPLNSAIGSAFFVKPVRGVSAAYIVTNGLRSMYYDPITNEIVYQIP